MAWSKDYDAVSRAAAACGPFPEEGGTSYALDFLMYAAGYHHDFDALVEQFGRETLTQSVIWKGYWIEAWAEGWIDAKRESRDEALRCERKACIESIEKRHPALLPKALPAIEACQDHALLCEWILEAANLDTVAFSARLGLPTP
jgi:hypothetical protein